jgi:hypothetical protein
MKVQTAATTAVRMTLWVPSLTRKIGPSQSAIDEHITKYLSSITVIRTAFAVPVMSLAQHLLVAAA